MIDGLVKVIEDVLRMARNHGFVPSYHGAKQQEPELSQESTEELKHLRLYRVFTTSCRSGGCCRRSAPPWSSEVRRAWLRDYLKRNLGNSSVAMAAEKFVKSTEPTCDEAIEHIKALLELIR